MGAEWGGRPVGSHGNTVAFSFHATKNITTIEGGAIAVPESELAERVERLRLQGLSRSAWNRHGSGAPADYDLNEPGFKLAMTDVAAALGVHQLAKLDRIIDRREELARHYDAALEDLPVEVEPPVVEGMRHGRHLYAVRLSQGVAVERDVLIKNLAERQIGTSIHFKPIHRFSYYRETRGLDRRGLSRRLELRGSHRLASASPGDVGRGRGGRRGRPEGSARVSVSRLPHPLTRYPSWQRTFDLFFATLLLLPAFVVGLLVAAAVFIDSPGPVLYRSRRIGRDGVPF